MVGATPAAAAAIVNGCCTLMATNPTETPCSNNIQAYHRNCYTKSFQLI